MPRKHILALVALVPFAVLFSFGSLVGRADSMDDVSIGKANSWIMLGPSWAVIAFIIAGAVMHNHPRRKAIALWTAVVVWVVIALTANWWEDRKLEMRRNHPWRSNIRNEPNTEHPPASAPHFFSGVTAPRPFSAAPSPNQSVTLNFFATGWNRPFCSA